MELNKYILEMGKKAGVCFPAAKAVLGSHSIDDLLALYVKNIDFCLANNFPSNQDLVKLSEEKINDYGIYVDSVKKLADRKWIVLLGKCNAELRYNPYLAAQLFIKGNSWVRVVAESHSYLIIDCFDDSEVEINAMSGCNVLVNIYGRAKVSSTGAGTVKVVHKFKDTY